MTVLMFHVKYITFSVVHLWWISFPKFGYGTCHCFGNGAANTTIKRWFATRIFRGNERNRAKVSISNNNNSIQIGESIDSVGCADMAQFHFRADLNMHCSLYDGCLCIRVRWFNGLWVPIQSIWKKKLCKLPSHPQSMRNALFRVLWNYFTFVLKSIHFA